MTTRQISETLVDIYGFEASEGLISDVTDRLLPQIEEWQNRPLDEVYPVLFIDAIHFSVRDNGIIKKLAAYIILEINCDRKKEVLTIEIGENESSKYWLSVLTGLKNRGVKDILIICADGLTGIYIQFRNCEISLSCDAAQACLCSFFSRRTRGHSPPSALFNTHIFPLLAKFGCIIYSIIIFIRQV